MKITFVEGTVEELKQAFPNLTTMLQSSAGVIAGNELKPTSSSTPAAAPANGECPLTIAAAEALLTRRPLSKLQAGVIQAIYEAGDAGMTSLQLAQRLKVELGSVKAAMRLFGKRAAHTEGWPEQWEVFERAWDGKKNTYRLHKPMREWLAGNRLNSKKTP